VFGRATITLGIGPHSSLFYFCTIALVTAFISVACTSVTCFSIKYSNTQIIEGHISDGQMDEQTELL